jgi:hypothetical protein
MWDLCEAAIGGGVFLNFFNASYPFLRRERIKGRFPFVY